MAFFLLYANYHDKLDLFINKSKVIFVLSQSKNLLKHGSFLFIAGLVGNISNYFYHFYMTRHLSVADYGILYSLIALMNILGVASGAIQLVIAQQISSEIAKGQINHARKLFWYTFRWTLMAGIVLAGGYIACIPIMKDFMQINTSSYFLLIAIPFLLSFSYPVLIGTLQGVQNFWGLGINGLCGSLGRLLLGIGLVMTGMGVTGALFAFPGSMLICIFLGFLMLWQLLFVSKDNNEDEYVLKLKSVFGHILPTIFALWLYQMLCQIDTLIVKHYFTEQEAGLYSAVSLVGKAFLYIPTAFTMVMVPQVSGNHAINRDTSHLLNRTILYGFILCLGGILVCAVFPKIILHLVSGDKYLSVYYLLQYFPIAITPMALAGVFVNYQLARLKVRFIISFLIMTIIHALLLVFFHANFTQVLWVIFASGSLIFLWNYYIVFKEVRTTS